MASLVTISLVLLLAPSIKPGIGTKLGIAYVAESPRLLALSSTEEVCRLFEQPVVFARGLEELALPNEPPPSNAQTQLGITQSAYFDFGMEDGSHASQNLPWVDHQDTGMINDIESEVQQLFRGAPPNGEGSYRDFQIVGGNHNRLNMQRPNSLRHGVDSGRIKRIKTVHGECDESKGARDIFSGGEHRNSGVPRAGISGTAYRLDGLASSKHFTRGNLIIRENFPSKNDPLGKTEASNSRQLVPGRYTSMSLDSWQPGIETPISQMIYNRNSHSKEGAVENLENKCQHFLPSDDNVVPINTYEPLSKLQAKRVDPEQQESEINNIFESKKVECQDLFTLNKPYLKVFPWIASLKTDNVSPETAVLFSRIYSPEFVIDFMKLSLLHISLTESTHGGAQNGVHQLSLQKKINSLFKIIWYLNSKVIQSFGVSAFDPRFELEHLTLKNWIVKSFLRQNYWKIVADSPMAETQFMKSKSMIQVQNILMEALRYEETYTDEVPYASLTREKTRISKGKTLLTEACIYLIGSYYKTMNPRKWVCFFQNEEKFLEFFASIKKRILFGMNKPLIDSIADSFENFLIIPWQKEWTLDEARCLGLRNTFQPFFTKNIMHSVDRYIELQEELKSRHAMMSEIESGIHFDKHFVLQKDHSVEFAWIGSIRLHFIPYPSKELFEDVYDSSFISKMENPLFSQIFSLSPEKKCISDCTTFKEKKIHDLRELARTVWYLNFKILQCFEIEDSDQASRDEQKYLQEWFLDRILSFESCGSLSDSNFHENDMGQVPQIVSKALNSRNKIDHRGKHDRYSDLNTCDSNSDEEFITAAIYIIGEYYKMMNYTKWICIFNKDEAFLEFVCIIRRYSQRKDGELHMRRVSQRFKDYNVIPWKNNWEHNPEDVPVFQVVFNKFLARNPGGWVERFMQNEKKNLSEYQLFH